MLDKDYIFQQNENKIKHKLSLVRETLKFEKHIQIITKPLLINTKTHISTK